MKTFKDLKIGDTVYSFENNHAITQPDFKIKETVINNIKLTDKGGIAINEYRGYSNVSYLCVLSGEECGQSDYQQSEYPRELIFVNKEDANQYVRDAVVKKIGELESSIPDFVKTTTAKIEEIRSHFYELLNPTNNPGFSII